MLERRVSKRSSATAMKHSLPLPPAGGATPKRSARADSHGSISVVDESYRALEMAHEELRELCAAQGDHLASLTTLAEERKLNESVFATMEAEHERTDAFLVELRGLLATLVGNTSTEASSSTSAGGRLQSSTVNTHAARSSAKSANSSTKAAHGAEMVAEGSPAVMAALREVVAQVRMKMAALEQVEQRHALRNRRLEKELKVVHQANTSSTDASTNSSEQCAVIAITNSAAEGLALQERIILLEDELKDATKDVQKLSQELRKHRQDLHTSTATVELQQKKIDELRAAMKRKDQHWADAEKRCRAAEGALVAGGTIAAPTRLSARGSSSNNSTSTSTAASPRDANNNIATPHTRLFTGAKMVELWEQCPTSLTQALIHDVAKALRLLDDAVYDVVWCRAPVGEPALHVRMMIRHGAQHSAEEIDTMVLAATCDALYALVLTSAAEKSTATASASVELMELRAQHATQVEELSQLRHRVREAEKELARRDDVEEDINVALENTANTLQDMHASMSAHRGEAERARAAEQEVRRELERCRTQSRQLESTIATLRASAEAEQSHAVDAAHLERVEAAHAATMKKISAQLDELTNQRDAATQALTRLQAKTTSKTSASAGGGGATTPRTPTSSAVMRESVEVAISLTQAPHVVPFLRAALRQDDDDGRTTSTVLANLLLAECALATGHAPRQMKRVEVKEAPPTLLATVELRCNVDGKTSSSALRDELHQLMHKRARFDTVVAYLEAQATAQQQQQQQLEKQPRSNTADAADVASLQAVDAILSEALTAVQRQTTQTPLQRAELLARRLRTLDTLVRSSRKEEGGAAHVRGSTSSVSSSLGNTTASAEVQELRDSLQRATQHKMDLEAQLKSMKEESASSTEALLCRVHRLEAALKEKRPTTTTTAVADGEEVRRLKEEVERLRCHERRAANTAEEQTQMIDDLRVQLAQARSMVANPSATSAPAMSATSSSSSFTQNTNNNNNNAESGVGAGVNLHAENQRLRVQLREMEVDMSDFARIQASLQQALDATQKELRATRNDKRALMQELATKDDQQRELRRRLRMSEERPEGGTPPLASRRASMDAISPMMPKSPRSPGVRLQRCHTAQVLPSSSAELRSEALDASGSSSMLFQRQASAGSVAPTTMRNTFTTISTSGPRTLTPTGSYSSTSDKTPTTTTQSFQRSHTAFSGEFSSARPPQPQQPTARGGEDPHSASLRRQQRINIRKLA